ncbi:MAG: hypothetical protein ABIR80_17655 [Opitutaceae bacterium]
MPRPTLHEIQGAPSWRLANNTVEAYLTRDGGHLAPVTFQTPHGSIQPFAVAPWRPAELARNTPPILRPLRGDFFCLPFGGNGTPFRGERHPPHGEPAGSRWQSARIESSAHSTTLVTELSPTVRPGRVVKRIELRAGETNLYCRHELSGFSGPMCAGHHAMLHFPADTTASLAFSPWHHGQICPLPFENAAQGGYFSLKTGAPFINLQRVPLAAGGTTDLSHYPARDGFEDLVMISSRARSGLGWSAATVSAGQGHPRYVWFALKNPRQLASTVLWHSNGGRHYAPWSSRHRRVIGIEEVTSYFHFGLAESAKSNPLSRRGVPTVLQLSPRRPTVIDYVMGVATPGPRFDRVRTIQFGKNEITLIAASGSKHVHPVDLTFFDSPCQS